MEINMDKVMEASFGEASSTIRAQFKKTVSIRQYETEVIEAEATVNMGDQKLSGIERMLIAAIMQAQLEYEAFLNLKCKGLITSEELNGRKIDLVQDLQSLINKAEELLGKPMDKYFELIKNKGNNNEV